MTRRPEIPGISQSARNDQFAGFLLGGAKGLVVAAFVAAAILRYGSQPIETVPWAAEQVKTSLAVQWTETYQPVPRIWSSPPVRHFVDHIQRMGLQSRARDRSHQPSKGCRTAPVRTASRPTDREASGVGQSSDRSRPSPRDSRSTCPPKPPSAVPSPGRPSRIENAGPARRFRSLSPVGAG